VPREKEAACRATARRAAIELFFQPVIFATQPLPLRLRPAQIFAQPFDLTRLVVDDLLRIAGRRLSSARRHATVIANPRSKYKYGILDSLA
jgi:hypothetical protein